MAQLSLTQAAQLGSSLTGLPVAFVQALIQEEGTINNGHNNPFDVTQYWASLYNQGGYLPGQGWGSQSGGNPNNPAGIATFTDTESAVKAWANGIMTDSNYTTLRSAIANTGNDFTTLANSFPAGYSGSSTPSGLSIGTQWANNVISLANSLVTQGVSASGTMPADLIQQASTGTTSGGLPTLTLPSNLTVPGTSDVASAVTNLANLIGQIPSAISAPFTNAFNQIQAVGAFLSQPHFLERILLLVGGGVLVLVGLILFALSFVKPPSGGAVIPVPVPV